jgi:hypothetical protein
MAAAPPHRKRSSAGLIASATRISGRQPVATTLTETANSLPSLGNALPNSLLGHGLTDQILLSNLV